MVFEVEVPALLDRPLPNYVPVSKFQSVTRDLAVVVPAEMEVEKLFDAVAAAKKKDLRLAPLANFKLFDLYRPQDAVDTVAEKSLAFAIYQSHLSRNHMYGRTVEIDRRNAARRITRIGIADNRIIHQIQTSRPRLKINSATSIGFIGKRTAFRSQPIIDECIIDKCTYHILRLAHLRINPVPTTDIIGYRIPRQQGKNHTVRISRTTLCRSILHEIGIRYMRPPTRRKCSPAAMR